MKVRRILFGFLVFALLSMGWVPSAKADAPEVTVLADGLNNPRGLAFSPDGKLYVAEAGSGGAGPCVEGPEGTSCYGESGAIVRIDPSSGEMARIITGLPSHAGEDGSAAIGPHDVSFRGNGGLYFTIGLGGDPTMREDMFGPGGLRMDKLMRAVSSRKYMMVTDLGYYEAAENPDNLVDENGNPVLDSNPYGVLALPGRQIVADAGGNSLLEVKKNGHVRTLAVFEDRMVPAPPFLGLPPGTMIPMQSVPTSVAQGPDRALYVGQLTGFPFPVGEANVYRVPARGGDPEVFASGFTNIVDIAFGPDGSMYVVEIARNGILAASGSGDFTGALYKVMPDGTKTEIMVDLFAPGGVAVGRDGAIYITNFSILSGAGQVLKIVPLD